MAEYSSAIGMGSMHDFWGMMAFALGNTYSTWLLAVFHEHGTSVMHGHQDPSERALMFCTSTCTGGRAEVLPEVPAVQAAAVTSLQGVPAMCAAHG